MLHPFPAPSPSMTRGRSSCTQQLGPDPTPPLTPHASVRCGYHHLTVHAQWTVSSKLKGPEPPRVRHLMSSLLIRYVVLEPRLGCELPGGKSKRIIWQVTEQAPAQESTLPLPPSVHRAVGWEIGRECVTRLVPDQPGELGPGVVGGCYSGVPRALFPPLHFVRGAWCQFMRCSLCKLRTK
jgi:hypothetical protein